MDEADKLIARIGDYTSVDSLMNLIDAYAEFNQDICAEGERGSWETYQAAKKNTADTRALIVAALTQILARTED